MKNKKRIFYKNVIRERQFFQNRKKKNKRTSISIIFNNTSKIFETNNKIVLKRTEISLIKIKISQLVILKSKLRSEFFES